MLLTIDLPQHIGGDSYMIIILDKKLKANDIKETTPERYEQLNGENTKFQDYIG